VRAKGLSKEEVQAYLKQAHKRDITYKSGKILCSMCTAPHPAAKKAQKIFLDTNLGDPGLFPGTKQLEKEVIIALSELLDNKSNVGFIVSGGTEANLLALYAAREKACINEPEVIVPESAHFSFNKICNILKLKLVQAKVDKSYRVDPREVAQLANKKTICIVGNAGSPELGVIDPIENLSQVAIAHSIPLHIDAAFGGLVIPFLKNLGYAVPNFDFKIEGVQSLTVDPHKMGMSTIPAGGILFRDNKVLERIKIETPYLTDQNQYTFIGTRSGASVAATWAVLASLGHEGFKNVVAKCMELTTFLYEGLEVAGFEVLLRPTMNIVAFRSANTNLLVDKLRQEGWYVSYVRRLNCIRIVIMPHTTKEHITHFLNILSELEPNKI
jgi:tyrosine decarboxylase / aspartate 1-decarboxylase